MENNALLNGVKISTDLPGPNAKKIMEEDEKYKNMRKNLQKNGKNRKTKAPYRGLRDKTIENAYKKGLILLGAGESAIVYATDPEPLK